MLMALAGQAALALFAIGALTLAPPQAGHMTLVPLTGGDEELAMLALKAGALPVARGRLPGSLVVDGSHDALAETLANRPILILAAPESICGIPKARR
ncbi:hypothetical protein [Sphingomonas sp.]